MAGARQEQGFTPPVREIQQQGTDIIARTARRWTAAGKYMRGEISEQEYDAVVKQNQLTKKSASMPHSPTGSPAKS